MPFLQTKYRILRKFIISRNDEVVPLDINVQFECWRGSLCSILTYHVLLSFCHVSFSERGVTFFHHTIAIPSVYLNSNEDFNVITLSAVILPN